MAELIFYGKYKKALELKSKGYRYNKIAKRMKVTWYVIRDLFSELRKEYGCVNDKQLMEKIQDESFALENSSF